MSLKVSKLQQIAHSIKKEQDLLESLKLETHAVLGYNVSISEGLDHACFQINHILDVMQAKGNNDEVVFKTSLAKKMLESKSREARRLAARTIQKNLVANLRLDTDSNVRLEACKRLSYDLVSEVVEFFPNDYELHYIAEQKKNEKDDDFLHLYDDKRLGKAAKPVFQPELSDAWYTTVAKKFLQDYGTNIEYQWEEPLIHRYCSSIKATTGVVVDSKKMYDKIIELIKQKEEEALLKDEKNRIKKLEKFRENVETNVADELNDLLKSTTSNLQFVSKINQMFEVKTSILPSGIRKYSSVISEVSLPTKAKIPGGKLTTLVEKVLDTYVESWNRHQSLRGEPIKISWSSDQFDSSKICFSALLK